MHKYPEEGCKMAENIYIPKLGMTMEEATLAEWKASEGDQVEAEQVVLVIDTEKVSHEIEAAAAGFLIILHEVGTVLKCGEVAGMIAETVEEYEKLKKERPAPAHLRRDEKPVIRSDTRARPKGKGKVRISPVARKMAEEHGIDITLLVGSGPGGRIVKDDILSAIGSGGTPVSSPSEVFDGKKVKSTIPLKGMRKVIAEHMHRSISVSAQITTMGEIEMTEMIKLRDLLLQREKSIGVRISYTDLFIMFVARALRDVPIMNSSLLGDEIKIWDDINIGFAVSIGDGIHESGLMVPVIRNADKKSLIEISAMRSELMEKARSGKIGLDDLMGGTFTITNMGIFGSEWSVSTPIINQPESAILGTGAIVERPVVREGQIVIRPVMTIMLTFDHRVLDGAPVGVFLMKLRELMLNPDLLLL
jgi:pyruvate dehydrogenase E2 component (dihydrolipoamide acetyltransferase)